MVAEREVTEGRDSAGGGGRRLLASGGRLLRLYVRSLGAHVRAALEYEVDFWIMIGAAVLVQVTGILFIGAIFARVPALDGWSHAEVILIFALVAIADGVGSLFFEGTWYLPWMVNQGGLDYTLVRPYPPVLQVMSMNVGMHGAGGIVTGCILLGWAATHAGVDWTVSRVLMAVVLLVSGVVIKLAITLSSAAASFWLGGSAFMFPVALHNVSELVRYPISVYGPGIQGFLTFVVPFAFVSYYPAAAMLGHDGVAWIGLLTPLVAVYCVVVARWIFQRGLRQYESAGA